MIISHRHKYLFIGLPLAASTAISKELCEMYDGKPILNKHSIYQDFLKIASPEEKTYNVIACSRNPLDISLSYYTKMLNNSSGNFSNPQLLRKNGGHLKKRDYQLSKSIREQHMDYDTFLKKYYRFPFDNWLTITKPHCQVLIRFENLQEDFEKALKYCGIKPKRPLPVINKTTEKAPSFESYYTLKNKALSLSIFGPYMKHHQIALPKGWRYKDIKWWDRLWFYILSKVRALYWINISYRNTKAQKVYKELLEKHQ